MHYRTQPKPVEATTPGLWSREELSNYLNVGHNEIPRIAERFSIPVIEGHFAERTVWRQLFGIDPRDDAAAELLRLQLQDINWLSREIGRAASTIRNRIKAGTFGYPIGVQLGETSKDGVPPRLRRWMPWEIPVAQSLTDAPALRRVTPIRAAGADALSTTPRSGPETHTDAVVPTDPNNVFATIAGGNTR